MVHVPRTTVRRLLAVSMVTTFAAGAMPPPDALSAPSRLATADLAALAAVPPITPIAVSRGFEPPATAYGPGHRGVDLEGAPGTPVRSALPGTVLYAGPVAGTDVVSVAISGGRRLTYEPLQPSVPRGARVVQGQVLGRLQAGHAECPVAACLHWGLVTSTGYADPLALVATEQVRLLPWLDPAEPTR